MASEPFASRHILLLVLTLALGACASAPPSTGPAAPPPAAAAPAPLPPAASAPPQSAAPEPAVREDKPLAQKLTLEAIDQLQNGDEEAARGTLERALAFDAGNDLARRMLEQIRADPVRELGATSFRYTVQPEDSLSKLAQRFLGDRMRFYILARYNEIANPSRLQVGQVIKIPGTAPAAAQPLPSSPRPAARPAESVETIAKPAPEPEPKQASEAERLYRHGLAQRDAGNLDGAYVSFNDAARREPGNGEYAKQAEAARRELVRRYDRDATQAFQRQNLDLAIKNWNRVLELDPGNQKARLERARAEDLKKRMQEKFGAK